jgi:hypothetical protein
MPAACTSGGPLADVPPADLAQAMRGGKAGAPRGEVRVRFGCVTGNEPEALILVDGELGLVGGSPGKLRRLWVTPAADAGQAAPIDVDRDGRHEVVTLGVSQDDKGVTASVRAWTFDGSRAAVRADARPFVVPAPSLPEMVSLWPEVHAQDGALVVGGALAYAVGPRLVTLVPLSPARVPLSARGGGGQGATPGGGAVAPAADAGAVRPRPGDDGSPDAGPVTPR